MVKGLVRIHSEGGRELEKNVKKKSGGDIVTLGEF